jgi:hypothetical protein
MAELDGLTTQECMVTYAYQVHDLNLLATASAPANQEVSTWKEVVW